MAEKGLFDKGEICIYDLDGERAEAMGRLLMKTPEYAGIDCKITWPASLDRALAGADTVAVILAPGTALLNELQVSACDRHGFLPSDNVSPVGSLLGVKASGIFLDLARRMERYCPQAWLLDFVNPIAVLSGMINKHTKIKALGLCGGFTNHMWDISRILGKDGMRHDIEVDVAGVNHLSFIVRGKIGDEEIFSKLDRALTRKWKMCPLDARWDKAGKANATRSVTHLVDIYRRLGVLIFSTEGDGMAHLEYEETLAEHQKGRKAKTRAQIESQIRKWRKGRSEKNAWFASHLDRDLDAEFWKAQRSGVLSRAEDDVFLRALRGIGGVERVRIVTSRINHGAIEGLPNDAVCEYSQFLHRQSIEPTGCHRVPSVVHGIIASLAVHQTMVGDACATGDPKMLAHALEAYPIRPHSSASRKLFKDLIKIGRADFPKSLRGADAYL